MIEGVSSAGVVMGDVVPNRLLQLRHAAEDAAWHSQLGRQRDLFRFPGLTHGRDASAAGGIRFDARDPLRSEAVPSLADGLLRHAQFSRNVLAQGPSSASRMIFARVTIRASVPLPRDHLIRMARSSAVNSITGACRFVPASSEEGKVNRTTYFTEHMGRDVRALP